ncbi:MAG: type II secretion system F family protein [Sphingomonadaceae bacterium]|nr:type II secretion system F family protein [Sphingomonadaceae bacterium]
MSTEIVRFIVLLAVFAAFFLLTQVLLGTAWRARQKHAAINARLRMIKEGGDREQILARLRKNAPSDHSHLPSLLAGVHRNLQRQFFAAAVPLGVGSALMIMLGISFAVFIVLLLAAGAAGFAWTSGVIMLLLVLGLCVGLALPLVVISIRAQHQRKRVEEQFPLALDIFVRALRSGHPVASAIDLLTHEMEDPMGTEFGVVADEVAYGADLNDALQAMAERWDNPDMRMFVVSLSLQAETGGNLAEILENLAEVIRARAAMYMKVRALSSEGRLTGWMLTILPIVSLLGMVTVNPGFYMDVARDPIFIWGFTGLILLYFIGVYAIRRMVDLKV